MRRTNSTDKILRQLTKDLKTFEAMKKRINNLKNDMIWDAVKIKSNNLKLLKSEIEDSIKRQKERSGK